MDPLTAIGTVASIVQLANAALSLSKNLYSLGAAVASASEDIQVLAQDLKTFSHSLTILSHLLEDSKSWYSDDIYLLTARIIKDCAELYVKIDKILAKLGSNGKSTWKLRVKFVYKEGQIKKLMKQLRDMKGTLATILMSLQVDLQLSLLNISSSSKIQRPAEKPLQPETVKTLREAQKAVEAADFLPKYSEKPEESAPSRSVVVPQSLLNRSQHVAPELQTMPTSSTAERSLRGLDSDLEMLSNTFSVTQSFVLLPSTAQMASSQATGHDDPSSTVRNVTSEMEAKTIKSSSSTESFKSAISLQEADLDIARQVRAVQAVMHAFRTALQILHNLIERRMPEKSGEIYVAAKDLQDSLHDRSKEIDGKHISHFKEHGRVYIERFTVKKVSDKLQDLSSTIMREVVMKLHEFAAEHEDLLESGFDALCQCSEDCSRRILASLDQLAPCQDFDPQILTELSKASGAHPIPSPGTGQQFQGWDFGLGLLGEKFATDIPPHQILEKRRKTITELHSSPGQRNVSANPRNDAPELSLPFIGYTFKRFDNSFADRERIDPSMPTPAYAVPPPEKSEKKKRRKAGSENSAAGPSGAAQPSQSSKMVILDPSSNSRNGSFGEANSGAAPEQFVLPSHRPHSPTTQARVLEDYHISLQLLKQQNKKRAMKAGQSSDATGSSGPQSQHFPISVKIDCPGSDESQQNVPNMAGEPMSHCGDLLFNPDSKVDVLQDFDFDSFLHQDEGASKQALKETQNDNSRSPFKCAFACQRSAADGEPAVLSVPEEYPIYVNAKQFHGILRRREARQALEEESTARKSHRPPSDILNEPTRNKETELTEVQASESTVSPVCTLEGQTQGERALAPLQIMTFNPLSGIYQVPVDVHHASRSADEKRVRNAGASARFRERRRQKEREAREMEVNRNIETLQASVANRHSSIPEPATGLPLNLVLFQPPTQHVPSQLEPDVPPTGSYNVPVDVSPGLRSADEKRPRNAAASARFRARRKEKEREAREKDAKGMIERIPKQSPGPHQSFTLSPSEDDNQKANPLSPLPINAFTGLPPTLSLYPPPPTQQASSRSDVCLSLSQSQQLWWRSFEATQVSNFSAFEVLRFELPNELGTMKNFESDDATLCKKISTDIKRFGERNLRHKHQVEGLNKILEVRSNVLRIVSTIDEQLGLQVATLGWSCVCVFLRVYERILERNFIPSETIDASNKAFTQLQNIVAIIARYAVMENLYQQSGSALSLKPEYESALISLCSAVLEHFAVSITLGRAMSGSDHTIEEKQGFMDTCEQLMETIQEKDRACQGFRVVVEAKEESESESEAGIEDVSDDSWEEVRVPSSEDDLIDLDAALV